MERLGEQIRRCVIVGAAPYTDAAYLSQYIKDTDFIIAADGGQRLLESMHLAADLTVGDFDSSQKPLKTQCKVLPTRKDDTDVMAAVRIALDNGFTSFMFLGCLGGRFDHTLANVFVLHWLLEHDAVGVLVDEKHEVSLLPPGDYSFSEREGWYVSLLPYGGPADGIFVKNAQYEVEDARFDISHPIGVSNGFTDGSIRISFKSGRLLMVLAKES